MRVMVTLFVCADICMYASGHLCGGLNSNSTEARTAKFDMCCANLSQAICGIRHVEPSNLQRVAYI